MVSQKFFISKILILILAFIAFVVCSFPSFASNWGYFEYEDVSYPFGKSYTLTIKNYMYKEIKCDVPMYGYYCKYLGGYQLYLCSREKPSYCVGVDSGGNETSLLNSSGNLNFSGTISASFSCEQIPYFVCSSETYNLHKDFRSYVRGNTFVDILEPIEVDWFNAKNDNLFSLQNVKGGVIDGYFVSSWDMPFFLPDNLGDMPLLVDFYVTDLDSGESLVLNYPSFSGVYGTTRETFYKVDDLSLSLNLNLLQGLPDNYKIGFVTLTPYYEIVLQYVDIPFLYKGQSTSVYLNYNGQHEYNIYTPAEQPIEDITQAEDSEKNIFFSITNFFSGFFNNFGNMLKSLFIPTESQLVALLQEMQDFFSSKLGFLWFPFDFAIEIVTAFLDGEQNTMFTVPPITINILDGVTLYEGGSFDIDETGIFGYVRFFSSVVLSCFTFDLALHKWDEFMKGGVAV